MGVSWFYEKHRVSTTVAIVTRETGRTYYRAYAYQRVKNLGFGDIYASSSYQVAIFDEDGLVSTISGMDSRLDTPMKEEYLIDLLHSWVSDNV